MGIFEILFRALSWFFDNIIYGLIEITYKLLVYLSAVDISQFDGIETIISRIYILLGVFMLFRLAFSIIQYVVSPDSFTDSSKGFGKLITNVMVSMVLLVMVPWLFHTLFQVQGYILKSNIIGRLVLGSSVSTVNNESYLDLNKFDSMARDTQFLLYSGFASINPETNDLNECAGTPIIGSKAMAQNPGCLEQLNTLFNNEQTLVTSNITLYDFFTYIPEQDTDECKAGEICDQRKFSSFGALASLKTSDGNFVLNYLCIVSALAGGYVVLLLISFCVDIALRAIKLVFLEMVAPISIISYIDPKESLSNSKLRSWINEVISTWASLFIRLLVIFLTMQLISIISAGVLGASEGFKLSTDIFQLSAADTPEDGDKTVVVQGVYQMFIFVFLVLGAFTFAKKFPELIEKLFGIKMAGDLSLNPLKSIRENILANPLVGGAVGGAIGSIAGTAGAIAASRDNKLGAGKTALNALSGFAAGGFRSSISGAKSGGKGLIGIGTSAAGRVSRAVDLRGTTSAADRWAARARNAVGMQSKFETLENRAKEFDKIKDLRSKIKTEAESELGKKNDRWKLNESRKSKYLDAYKNGDVNTMKSMLNEVGFDGLDEKIKETNLYNAYKKDYMQSNNISSESELTDDMKAEILADVKASSGGFQADDLHMLLGEKCKQEEDTLVAGYINDAIKNGSGTTTIQDYLSDLNVTVADNHFDEKLGYDVSSWDGISKAKDNAESTASSIRNTDEYRDARKTDEYVKSARNQKHYNG